MSARLQLSANIGPAGVSDAEGLGTGRNARAAPAAGNGIVEMSLGPVAGPARAAHT